MARFRVRNRENNGWMDVSEHDMFVWTEDNNWLQLLPDKFSIRNVWGMRWHQITDEYDPNFDDPCDFIETGACDGGPTSQTKGSGNGMGSAGPVFDTLLGYPAGYDLPDAGRSGFGLRVDHRPPTGRSIRRPGIKTVESYDPVGVASRYGLGTYANPNIPYASVHGRGAAITETIYAFPSYNGYVEVLFACYSAGGVSVDVYHMGQRVASTCGRVAGRSRIVFELDPTQDDLRVMIRVRGEAGCNWSLQCLPPHLSTPPERGNLPLDHQMQYDVINFPDIIHPDYIGSPIFPAPCHATVWPIAERLTESSAFEYYHYVGNSEGTMYLDYTSWSTFDFIEVYQAGSRIATTLDAQTLDGYLKFEYNTKDTLCCDLMVRIVSKDFGIGDSLTSMYYSLYCPDVRGAREYRHPCQTQWITSAGHPTTEDQFQMTVHGDLRGIVISLNSGNFDTTFEVFDENMVVLDTMRLAPSKTGTLEFWNDPSIPAHTSRDKLTVRATSAIGCDWTYFVYCPAQPPKIDVPDYTIPYRCVEYGIGTLSRESAALRTAPWELITTGLRYWGRVDRTTEISFKVATEKAVQVAAVGTSSDMKEKVLAENGYIDFDTGPNSDLIHSNLSYESWNDHLNGRDLSRVKCTLRYSGSVDFVDIIQQPTKYNDWTCVLGISVPQEEPRTVDLSITTTAIYE